MRRPSLSRALRLFGSGTGADPQCRLLWTGFLLPLSDAGPCRKDLDAVARASRTGPAFVRTRDRRPAPADREAARVAPHGSPGSLEEHQRASTRKHPTFDCRSTAVRTLDQMSPGSPRDRRFELKSWFESYVPVQVIGSNSATAGLTAREPLAPRPGPNPLPHGTFADPPGTPTEKRRHVSMAHYTDCQARHAGAGLKASAHRKS